MPFSPHPYGWEVTLPQAEISVKCSFWNNLSLNVPEICFPTRLLNDSISWTTSNHKTSEALSTQKTGWSSSLPFLPPQVPPSYQVTSAERPTHLDSTAPHPPKHLTKPDPMGGQLVLLMSQNFFYSVYKSAIFYPLPKHLG